MTQNQDWKLLYRIGAIAALLAAILFRRNIGAELSLFIEIAPQSAAEWYVLLQTKPFTGLASLAVFDLANYFLVGLLFLALTVAFWQRNKSLVIIALYFFGLWALRANSRKVAAAPPEEIPPRTPSSPRTGPAVICSITGNPPARWASPPMK